MRRPCLISVACRRWRRQPICVGVPCTWNSVCRAIIGVAVTGRGHWCGRRSPKRTSISGVVWGRRRWRKGPTLIWVERRVRKTVSDDGWRGRGRRRHAGTLVVVGGHAIRTGSILLIVIYHAISVPLSIVRAIWINCSSRGRGRQRRGGVTWGYVAKTTPHVARWRRLGPLSWITWGPIATPVWGRRGVIIPFFMSGTTLGNLDMDAFAYIKK